MECVLNDFIDMINDEFKKDDNRLKEKVLDPIVKYLGKQLLPYVFISVVFLSILIILLVYIALLTHKIKNIKIN